MTISSGLEIARLLQKVAGVIEVCEDIQTLKAKNLFALDVALNEIHPDAVKLEEKKK